MNWTEEAIEKMADMLGQGLPYSKIAGAFNVTKNQIAGCIYRVPRLKRIARERNGTRPPRKKVFMQRSGGSGPVAGRVDPQEIRYMQSLKPNYDERDLTGRMFGDPPPHDQRRAAWAPHLAGGA